MKIYMDLHTHTMASGHGYSTLAENIEEGRKQGLAFLGLSEHGPAMPGGPHIFFFHNYRCIPRQYGEMKLLCGAEANIMDYDGRLDLEEDTLKRLDYVIASMHVPCVAPGTEEENTRASIEAMRNPYVKILGHPDDSRYALDRKAVVKAAGEEGVAIEINNSSLNPLSARKGGRDNIIQLLDLCGHYEVPVLMGSDSHICYGVGRFEETLRLMEEMGFPEKLVLNAKPDNIRKICNWE